MADRTWQESLNNVPLDATSVALNAKSFLWFLVQFLTGGTVETPPALGRWDMYYSCDSVTAGVAGDGVNRWTGLAQVVRAAAGVAHSWAVVRSQAALCGNGPYYCIIDVSGSADYTLLNLIFSKTAPTGGTTTARPTSVDEWTHAVNQQVVENAIAGWRYHAWMSTDGNFVIGASKNGSNFIWTAIAAFDPEERPSGFTPYRLLTYAGYSASGALQYSIFQTVSNWRGRKFDNSGNYSSISLLCRKPSGSTYGLANIPAGGDIYGSDSPRDQPYILIADSGYVGIAGRLPDHEWGCSLQGPIVHPLGGSVLLTDLWVPLTAVPLM